MGARENPHAGLRDFVIFALTGAISAFVATLYENSGLIVAGFFGLLTLLLLAYWADREKDAEDPGITTEATAIVAFFLGVLTMKGRHTLSIALAIAMLAILSQKRDINRFRAHLAKTPSNPDFRRTARSESSPAGWPPQSWCADRRR